jgi:hypothetical protein
MLVRSVTGFLKNRSFIFACLGMLTDLLRFNIVRDAMTGEGGFLSGDHLVKHPRESDEKLARRKALAVYTNFIAPACGTFLGYLTKKPVVRDSGSNALFQQFIDNCDMRGNSLSVWMADFMVQAKARGCMLALVDMPTSLPETSAEQVQGRAIPYLVPIYPETISKLDTDDFGRITRIAWNDVQNDKMITREWDSMRWKVSSVTGGIISEGEHGLDIVPIIEFSESLNFPHFGGFAQIAELSREYYNVHSEKRELFRAQTFSILNYIAPQNLKSQIDIAQVASSIGTENMLMSYDNAAQFIAPPDGPASLYQSEIKAIIADRHGRDGSQRR